jgi:transketolase
MPETDFTMQNRQFDARELSIITADLRKDILEALGKSNSGHPGGSLSAVEILTSLYFYKMRHNPKNPKWEDRDRFLLSKGHAAPVLYCVLAKCGYFPKEELGTLRKLNSRLQGHPDPNKLPGVEIPGGPEGIGLSEGIGMALAARLDNRKHTVYVLMGDGEQDEGEVWEAAMSAVKFKLSNLVAMIDMNGVQQEGTTSDIMPTDSLASKWRSFNWNVIEVDGHDLKQLASALDAANKEGFPTVIIAKTVKGKGVDFMEGNPKYHGTVPGRELLEQAIKQVEYKGD